MDQRDESDLTTVVDVLRTLRSASTDASEVWVRDVLAHTTLQMPRVVALTRRYSDVLAVRLGVGRVQYEPSRYQRYVGPVPARIHFTGAPSGTAPRLSA